MEVEYEKGQWCRAYQGSSLRSPSSIFKMRNYCLCVSLLTFLLFHVCIYLVCMCVPMCTQMGHGALYLHGRWFTPSTVWVPGIQPRLSRFGSKHLYPQPQYHLAAVLFPCYFWEIFGFHQRGRFKEGTHLFSFFLRFCFVFLLSNCFLAKLPGFS